jgi:hypothetical protein
MGSPSVDRCGLPTVIFSVNRIFFTWLYAKQITLLISWTEITLSAFND